MPFAQSIWDTIPDAADHIAAYLDIEEVPPETPTDEVPVEDIPPETDEHWLDAISDLEAPTMPFTNLFDEFGDYRKCVIFQDVEIQAVGDYDVPLVFFDTLDEPISNHIDDVIDQFVYDANRPCLLVHNDTLTPSPRIIEPKAPDYEKLRPLFGCWLPTDITKCTFEVMKQYARMPMSTLLKKRYKSPNPSMNVHRCDEAVATDTVYSDKPAIDGGVTTPQIFVGTKSLNTTDVLEGMKMLDKQFVNTLEDNIRRCGTPTKLISDRTQPS
jgi:hypothetical protein